MKVLWLVIFWSVFVWSAIEPKNTAVWFLEAGPALIGFFLLAYTYKRFRLTPLLYGLILLHSVVLMVGAHYTYAEVPGMGFLGSLFDSERNNYDKIGHFLQGFVPAILAREILIRRLIIDGRYWVNFIVVSICLAFSAFYELLEWLVAVLSDEAGDAFLGSQGYIWDTQSDMGFALLGAIAALLFLSTLHDSQMRNLSRR